MWPSLSNTATAVSSHEVSIPKTTGRVLYYTYASLAKNNKTLRTGSPEGLIMDPTFTTSNHTLAKTSSSIKLGV
jgi:hypothetical protein